MDPIWIVVALIAAGLAIIWYIAGSQKMSEWNNDPRQQNLVELFVYAGEGVPNTFSIGQYIDKQIDWTPEEKLKRIAHALTVVQRVSRRTVFEEAHRVALIISEGIKEQARGK